MISTVTDRSRAIATFRHVSVRLMETVARWTPITPEMEAKVMFGRHIWDFAQMANWLGERTFELRQPKHFTLPPVGDYDALLAEAAEAQTTGERLAALYEGLLPGLAERYRRYLAVTDAILDEPTVVIMQRIVRELERQRAEAAALCDELKLRVHATSDIAARERRIANIVAQESRT